MAGEDVARVVSALRELPFALRQISESDFAPGNDDRARRVARDAFHALAPFDEPAWVPSRDADADDPPARASARLLVAFLAVVKYPPRATTRARSRGLSLPTATPRASTPAGADAPPRRRARARGAVGRGPPREVRDARARRAPHRGRPGGPRGDARRPGDGRGARRAGSRAPRLRRRAQKVRTKPKPKLGSELGARKSGFFRKLRRGFFDARGRGSGEREGDVVEAHRSGRAQDRNPRRRRGRRRESRRGARRRRARGDARRVRDPARRHVRARAR